MTTLLTGNKLYIAGTGLVSPVGADSNSTVAAVAAGISSYRESYFQGENDESLITAAVPEAVLDAIGVAIDEVSRARLRSLSFAVAAIQEACKAVRAGQAFPLVLALPALQNGETETHSCINQIAERCRPWIDSRLARTLYSGRVGGMEALQFAFDYLYAVAADYLLVASSDSYFSEPRLRALGPRLLTVGTSNTFAPGEAGACLLLTKDAALARVVNGHVIALSAPNLTTETGHIQNDEPCRGDGLSRAFQGALSEQPEKGIQAIYSTMNGEYYWAKELGIAKVRNQEKWADDLRLEHPAECWGDLGAASATALIALAAHDLWQRTDARANLVYTSADDGARGAVVLEKLPLR